MIEAVIYNPSFKLSTSFLSSGKLLDKRKHKITEYTGSRFIAITSVYGDIYFIISVIKTKTSAVQTTDNINKYIKSDSLILNKKTSG